MFYAQSTSAVILGRKLFETYGIINSGSGWRKDVVSQSLESGSWCHWHRPMGTKWQHSWQLSDVSFEQTGWATKWKSAMPILFFIPFLSLGPRDASSILFPFKCMLACSTQDPWCFDSIWKIGWWAHFSVQIRSQGMGWGWLGGCRVSESEQELELLVANSSTLTTCLPTPHTQPVCKTQQTTKCLTSRLQHLACR